MERRQFLKLLAMGVAGLELDLDRLLWIPGQKTIFLPTYEWDITRHDFIFPTEAQIVAREIDKMIPKIKSLFDTALFFDLEKL